MELQKILEQTARGILTVEAALASIQQQQLHDLGFARVDLHRHQRRGLPEVIFCPGKTPEQVAKIMATLAAAGQNVLATRAARELFEYVFKFHPQAVYHPDARLITLDVAPLPKPAGLVCVLSAGTADLPVAEEAAITAERCGACVERIFDVGVAGLHRLVAHLDRIKQARALVIVAGMEGALPSVVGGLVDRPIIAVPTSVGYGTHFQGLATLLAMLNSCSPGITVVNIDNGFGAGVAAALINRAGTPS